LEGRRLHHVAAAPIGAEHVCRRTYERGLLFFAQAVPVERDNWPVAFEANVFSAPVGVPDHLPTCWRHARAGGRGDLVDVLRALLRGVEVEWLAVRPRPERVCWRRAQ